MSFLWFFIEVFINTIEYVWFYFLLRSKLDNRFSFRQITGLMLLIVFLSIQNYLQLPSLLIIFSTMIADVLYAFLCFQGAVSEKMFWGCAASVISIIGNEFVFFTGYVFSKEQLSSSLEVSRTRLLFMLIYVAFISIIYYLIIRKRSSNFQVPFGYRIAFIILVGAGVLSLDDMLSVLIHTDSYAMKPLGNRIIISSGIYMMILICMLYLFGKVSEVLQENMALSLELQQNKMKKSHIEEIENMVQAMRVWKHDNKQHMDVIQSLLAEENIKELKKFVESINGESIDSFGLISTGHKTCDAILSNKIMTAREKGIDTKYEIVFPNSLPVAEIDLCIILGNLLDNAIEACLKTSDPANRYIHISIKNHRRMFYIKVVNSSSDKYLYSKGKLLTTKIGPEHGLGCKRVEEISSKYDGFCNFEAQSCHFTATVMFPLQK